MRISNCWNRRIFSNHNNLHEIGGTLLNKFLKKIGSLTNRKKDNKPTNALLTKGTLTQHLAEVQQRATEMEETLVRQMAQKEGLTEELKATDMMKWVRLMNNLRNSAQEVVKAEVIFA